MPIHLTILIFKKNGPPHPEKRFIVIKHGFKLFHIPAFLIIFTLSTLHKISSPTRKFFPGKTTYFFISAEAQNNFSKIWQVKPAKKIIFYLSLLNRQIFAQVFSTT